MYINGIREEENILFCGISGRWGDNNNNNKKTIRKDDIELTIVLSGTVVLSENLLK